MADLILCGDTMLSLSRWAAATLDETTTWAAATGRGLICSTEY